MKVRDWLTFKSATRDSFRKAERKIRYIDPDGRPCVGYNGWTLFIVQIDEIMSVREA